MTTVICTIPNGLDLRSLGGQVGLAGTDRVLVNYGPNEVPDAFWTVWLAANQDADYVTNGLIFAG